MARLIDGTLLREAVEKLAERESWHELALRIGWRRPVARAHHEHGEVTRLQRALGIVPEGGKSKSTKWMREDTALTIARGLDIDPIDIGL